MKKALFIDFSLPIFLEKMEISSYNSFVKNFIKNLSKTHNIKYYVSVNVFNSLHLSPEVLNDMVSVLKSLYDQGRLEFVYSSNFDTFKSNQESILAYDYLFSEYYLAFNFGEKRNFEGDPSLMLRNTYSAFFSNLRISNASLNSSKLLNYTRIFVDSSIVENYSFYKGTQLIPLSKKIGNILRNFVTNEAVLSFLREDTHDIYFINLHETFSLGIYDLDINFSNLLYFLDKNTNINYTFIDPLDENVVFERTLSSSVLEMLEERVDVDRDLNELKASLTHHLIHHSDTIDSQDFMSVSIWGGSSNEIVNRINLFNLHLLILTSDIILRRNLLLNPKVKVACDNLIDGLLSSEFCNSELSSKLSKLKDKIN